MQYKVPQPVSSTKGVYSGAAEPKNPYSALDALCVLIISVQAVGSASSFMHVFNDREKESVKRKSDHNGNHGENQMCLETDIRTAYLSSHVDNGCKWSPINESLMCHYIRINEGAGMMITMNDAIKSVIEKTVRDRFASDTVQILDIKITDDFDDRDQAIFTVTVIYQAPTGVLDPDKTLGIVRHTRSRLAEENDSSFPIFRFVSQSDAKKIGIAAA